MLMSFSHKLPERLLSLLSVFLIIGLVTSCVGPHALSEAAESTENNEEKRTVLKVTAWNVETFFDGENSGNEYAEFVKSKKWGREAYAVRLQRLCSAIKAFDCDVLVMEEIENQLVLQDIANFLAGEWNVRKLYSYACFAREEGSSIGVAVLSRYPLSNLQLHSIDVRTESDSPSLRPLLQVEVSKEGKKLVLLVNHWKSMSGGEEETEKWRNWQEAVMGEAAGNILQKDGAILAAGDFNRDIEKFCRGEGNEINAIEFRKAVPVNQEEGCLLKSPWILSSGNLVEPGSYFFKGQWSRIDNFFYGGDLEVLDFRSETNGPWCSEEDQTPLGYELWSGEGYSDHLPISIMVKF